MLRIGDHDPIGPLGQAIPKTLTAGTATGGGKHGRGLGEGKLGTRNAEAGSMHDAGGPGEVPLEGDWTSIPLSPGKALEVVGDSKDSGGLPWAWNSASGGDHH